MFLTGTPRSPTPEERRYHHISSAIVTVIPCRITEVSEAIGRMGGAEIRACENGRIVVVLEGSSSLHPNPPPLAGEGVGVGGGGEGGDLGELLMAIGNLDGVIAANLVFEHVEELRGTEA